MKKYNLIRSVERIRFHHLAGMTYSGRNMVILPLNMHWERIPVKVPASMTIAQKIEDGNTIHTVTLEFLTCAELTDTERYAWRVTLLDGRSLLIGTSRHPYPVAVCVQNFPDAVQENQLDKVTVTYSSGRPIPYIM